MPTQTSTTIELAAELADVNARAWQLGEREVDATRELESAEAEHGRLYARGTDAATTKRQAATVTALRVELDGLAQGRLLLAQQTETLTRDLSTVRAREALATARASITELAAAVARWQEHAREVLGPASEFGRVDAALRTVGERARAATGVAMNLNPAEAGTADAAYRAVWAAFPVPLFEMLATYRNA